MDASFSVQHIVLVSLCGVGRLDAVNVYIIDVKCKKSIKFSYTRYRALGLKLIPVYRQSARR